MIIQDESNDLEVPIVDLVHELVANQSVPDFAPDDYKTKEYDASLINNIMS